MIGSSHPKAFVLPSASRVLSPLADTRLSTSGFLSLEERLALEDALSPARSLRAHFDLVREGAPADALFIVTEGWVCRYATTPEGGRQISALLIPGDIANLDALLFDQIDHGVRSITDARVVALPRHRALALAERYPAIARAFTWFSLAENAILRKWTLSLGRHSAVQRLAHLLCELSVRLDAQRGEESRFHFPLTQELLADVLGLTAVHVNRSMQRLRSEGLIETASRTMTIRDVPKLRELGGFDPRYLQVGSAAHTTGGLK